MKSLRPIPSAIWHVRVKAQTRDGKTDQIVVAGAENGQLVTFSVGDELSSNQSLSLSPPSASEIATVLRVGEWCYMVSESGKLFLYDLERDLHQEVHEDELTIGRYAPSTVNAQGLLLKDLHVFFYIYYTYIYIFLACF